MPNIFFIADTHFGEDDVFRMARENYRFRTCEIKDRILIENWNRVVRPEDTVYILGDFGIGYTLKNEPFYFDLEDYNLIKDYCWAIDNNGYVYSKRKELVLIHRLVMNAPKGKVVDHIYHKKYDNRKS